MDPDKIPEGFTSIPADSDMGSVRSSIAGTREAKEAILENQIPQTAEVDRWEARLDVNYDGQPRFEQVGNTRMNYAVNTDKSVLQIDKLYYCCDNAIWFESGSALGPWMVSTEVPAMVQEIPPESPVYNVKYVYIYDSTPEVVYVGYTPGYIHSYAYRGCVYYGTGYYYRPWYGVRYYSRPLTYGYRAFWNPYTGWGFSFGYSYNWMTYGWGSPYRGWWGPIGYRSGYHYGYRHSYSSGYRAGYYEGSRSSSGRPAPYAYRARPTSNVYNNRAQGVRRTGNKVYDPGTGNRVSTAAYSSRPVARPSNTPNNVYTDRQGNVYRKDGNDWNRVNNGRGAIQRDNRTSPENVRPPVGQQPATRQQASPANSSTSSYTRPASSPASILNREYNSRSQGAARSQQYQRSKPQYQPSRPAATKPSTRSAAPSRSAPGRSAEPSKRR
ncbi:MAG: hypothetical protein P1P86_05555 [Bacteroidales bacterium]|nr:hypothetical protein [Bacteroidales bacterium]